MNRIALAAALLASTAAPLAAETRTIAPGEGAQERLQEALILAAPGDEIVLEPGRFVLTEGLSLDVDGVTVRGAGMGASVLDFTTQQGAGEGLLVTSDNVTLRDFAVENPKGDGIKSKGADNIIYYRVRVTWTGGPKETNGAYGIYPVESTGVLIDGCTVSGASDAGIYVGQSKDITVRHSVVEYNVAGIEIENSRNARVHHNLATRNTGGILVFDLPGLPVMNGGHVVISDNLVVDNDTPNFAPPGNIVASVRRGTGVMVMANDDVQITRNRIDRNPTTAVMVISYPNAFDDARYNPAPRRVVIDRNSLGRNAYDPQIDGAPMLLAAFGGSLPPVLWDGLGEAPTAVGESNASAWSLGLTQQGAGFANARPVPAKLNAPAPGVQNPAPGAPAELEARIK
jgi:parallel beta-helix repeat protein